MKSIRFRLAAQMLEACQDIVIAEIRRVLPREVDPALLGKVNAEAQVVDLVELAVEARRDPWEALRFAAIDASGSQFVGPAGQSGQQVLELVAWWEDAKLPPDSGATEVALDASGFLRGEALVIVHSVNNHPLPLPRGDVPHARLQPLQIETVQRKVRSTVHSGPPEGVRNPHDGRVPYIRTSQRKVRRTVCVGPLPQLRVWHPQPLARVGRLCPLTTGRAPGCLPIGDL